MTDELDDRDGLVSPKTEFLEPGHPDLFDEPITDEDFGLDDDDFDQFFNDDEDDL